MPDRTPARLNDLEGWRYRHQTHEIGPTPGEMYAMFLGLPSLRGYWPMSSQTQDAGDLVYDLSGQGRSLTRIGAAPAVYNEVVPYLDFNGTTDRLIRADETGLDITSALTLGGWFWFDGAAAAVENVIGKRAAAGQLSYYLSRTAAGLIKMEMSSGGTAVFSQSSAAVVGSGVWNFIAGRFTPSTEVALFLNGVKATNTTSIPAAIFNSTVSLTIGAQATPAEFFNGRASICFLCAAALSDNLLSLLFNRSRSLFGA